MNGFDSLLACAGAWEGINRVQVTHDEPVEESASRLVVTPVLHDTFVRFDQTWSWKGEAQSGSLLIGYNPKTDQASVHWVDTWHNGRRVMPLAGRFDADGRLVALGHFPVPDGHDWGWRMEISVRSERLKIDMFCLEPGGKEDGGVWVAYARA